MEITGLGIWRCATSGILSWLLLIIKKFDDLDFESRVLPGVDCDILTREKRSS